MLEGQNIICFAKDWSEDPTSNNHVMKMLARRNRVLWLNSIAMRAPKLGSKSDLTKMVRKLKSFTDGPVEVAENLWTYTPIVVPLPHSPGAAAINRQILRWTLTVLRRKLKMDSYQLWTFLPNALPYLGMPGETLSVYYCIDEWAHFSYLDGGKMAEMERELCGRADVVFATATLLYESRRAWNPNTHVALHGVDHGHFAQALSPETPPAPELADFPRPILGFFGLIHEWFDLDLVAALAARHPEWTIALIGKVSVDVTRLQGLPNVKFLGRKPYASLPSFCKSMSVGLIPFQVNELTLSVNPIKLREYLSAGLPVVSTALPEVAAFGSLCHVANSHEEFIAACERAVREDTPERRRKNSAAMLGETWEAKVNELGRRVNEAAARKRGQPPRAHSGDGRAAVSS
jgi:glycosyltransferase involved in cell wall biosynthesis